MKIKKMLMVAIVAIVAIAAPFFSTKAFAAEENKIDEYTPVDITVPFTKVWDGGEDERPESVTVNLYRFREGDLYQGAEPFATAKVSGEDGWKYEFDLKDSESDPLFYRDADGNYHPYSFATDESPIPGFTDIARKNPELVLKIEKAGEHDDIWIKPSDANGFEINTKDTPMSFIAMKSGETLYIWTPEKLSLSEQIVMFEAVAKHPDFPTEWKDTTFLTGYGHYDKGGFATSADKVEFDDFSVWSFWARGTYVRSTTDQLSASITSVVDLTDVTVTVRWDAAADAAGLRPETLALTLSPNTDGVEPTVAKDGSTWTYTWTGLPKTDADGSEIAYTVAEENVPEGYKADPATVAAGGTITNSHEPAPEPKPTPGPEPIDVTVTVKWDDADNKDGIRPETLELTLNGVPEGTPPPDVESAKDGNTWTYTWKGLPKTDADGKDIAYTATEAKIPDGYKADPATVAAGGTITNVHEPKPEPKPETVDVTATVKWDDASNRDGLRPQDLALTLKGLPKGTEAPKPEVKKDGGVWTYTWTGLPKFDGGKEIAYTVSEGTVPTGYEAAGTPAKAGGTITNTHKPGTVSVTVTVKWDDADNSDGLRPQDLALTL
ncbi:MAG: Cna B-type domain-containing protein, partial [Atopobiaceae bacterium]|nr:Cna B-type domain-containing protein [Atopobiaceae bacterium]